MAGCLSLKMIQREVYVLIVTDDECLKCEYYDKEEGICGAFECNGLECPTLPCEENN